MVKRRPSRMKVRVSIGSFFVSSAPVDVCLRVNGMCYLCAEARVCLQAVFESD